MDDLRDQTAVVTGGSRGFGRGIVEALAGAGMRVVALARDPGALAALGVQDHGRRRAAHERGGLRSGRAAAAPPARVVIAAPGCAAPRRCLALTGRQSGGPTRDSSQSRNRLSG